MSETATKYGILVGVEGSPASDAAVTWASREAVSRRIPLTLMHVIAPVVVGWPVGQLYANMPEWQKDNAQHVIEHARRPLPPPWMSVRRPKFITRWLTPTPCRP